MEVTGQETPAQKTGRSVFRALIPMERLLADEDIRRLYSGHPNGYLFASRSDKANLLITYPCRDNTVLNVALVSLSNP